MSGTAVKIEGLDETIRTLKALGARIERKILRQSLGKAATTFKKVAKKGAREILAAAQMRGYKRKQGQHLFQTVTSRVKSYTKNGVVYCAAGPGKDLAPHAYLVEAGHRIVRGGTNSKSGKTPGLTAAGRRHIRKMGFTLGEYYEWRGNKSSLSSRVRNRWVAKKGMQNIATGQWFERPGMHFMGSQVRGGGVANGVVPPHPYMKPAWDATKGSMLSMIVGDMQAKCEKECAKAASENGVKT